MLKLPVTVVRLLNPEKDVNTGLIEIENPPTAIRFVNPDIEVNAVFDIIFKRPPIVFNLLNPEIIFKPVFPAAFKLLKLNDDPKEAVFPIIFKRPLMVVKQSNTLKSGCPTKVLIILRLPIIEVTPLRPSNCALVVNIKSLAIVIIFSGHEEGTGGSEVVG